MNSCKRFCKTPQRLHQVVPDSPESNKYRMGQFVMAQWREFEFPNTYRAQITKIHKDGNVDLDFDDGSYWDNAPQTCILEVCSDRT